MSADSSVSAPAAGPATGPSATVTAHVPMAVLSLLAGAVLLAGSYLGTVALLVAVAILQVALVFSWVLGTALPGRIGAIVLGVLAAGAADAVVSRWSESGFGPVLGVLGVAIPAMFTHQLTRGVVRTRVVESMADITVLLMATVSLSGLLLLRHRGDGDSTAPAVIAAIAGALAAAHIVDAVFTRPRLDPSVDRGLPAVVVGALVGALLGLLWLRRIIDFTGGRGAFLGASVGAVACLISVGVTFAGSHSGFDAGGRRPAIRRLRPIASALLTVALAAPVGYAAISAFSG